MGEELSLQVFLSKENSHSLCCVCSFRFKVILTIQFFIPFSLFHMCFKIRNQLSEPSYYTSKMRRGRKAFEPPLGVCWLGAGHCMEGRGQSQESVLSYRGGSQRVFMLSTRGRSGQVISLALIFNQAVFVFLAFYLWVLCRGWGKLLGCFDWA